jgi:hypothetical protein
MKHVPHVLPAAVASLLAFGVLASTPEEPKIHECRDAAGNVMYQDDPCPETPRPEVAAPAPTKPPAATAERRAPARVAPVPTASRALRQREWSVAATGGRFASPEDTWRAFVSAIGSGDRAAAAACLTPSALRGLGADAGPFPLEALRATVSAFTRIEVDGEVGPFWSIRASRPNARPLWIFFERDERGEWKIAAI